MALPNSIKYRDIPTTLTQDVISTMVLNPSNGKTWYIQGDNIYLTKTLADPHYILILKVFI